MPSNLLINGGFNGNLYQWSGTGTINRTAGYPRLGCVSLASGAYIQQARDIGANWLYTAHFFYQVATGATLTVSYNTITQTFTGSPLNVWREGVFSFALDSNVSNGALRFAASDGACLVDSVTFLSGGLPATRAQIVTAVADNLSDLATDAGLSSTASASGPEGDYTLNLDDCLRAAGAVSTFGSAGLTVPTDADPSTWGDPDITQLEQSEISSLIQSVTDSLLTQVRSKYALETDVSLGPRRESRSQIVTNINALLGGGKSGGGGAGRVSVGKLTNGDWPR